MWLPSRISLACTRASKQESSDKSVQTKGNAGMEHSRVSFPVFQRGRGREDGLGRFRCSLPVWLSAGHHLALAGARLCSQGFAESQSSPAVLERLLVEQGVWAAFKRLDSVSGGLLDDGLLTNQGPLNLLGLPDAPSYLGTQFSVIRNLWRKPSEFYRGNVLFLACYGGNLDEVKWASFSVQLNYMCTRDTILQTKRTFLLP